MKKQKLYFTVDGFYNNPQIPLYDHGKVYEVEDVVPNYIDRWLSRGAMLVEKGSKHDKMAVSLPNDQGGGDPKKKATPVGGDSNPIELAPVKTAPPKTDDEPPKADGPTPVEDPPPVEKEKDEKEETKSDKKKN